MRMDKVAKNLKVMQIFGGHDPTILFVFLHLLLSCARNFTTDLKVVRSHHMVEKYCQNFVGNNIVLVCWTITPQFIAALAFP